MDEFVLAEGGALFEIQRVIGKAGRVVAVKPRAGRTGEVCAVVQVPFTLSVEVSSRLEHEGMGGRRFDWRRECVAAMDVVCARRVGVAA